MTKLINSMLILMLFRVIVAIDFGFEITNESTRASAAEIESLEQCHWGDLSEEGAQEIIIFEGSLCELQQLAASQFIEIENGVASIYATIRTAPSSVLYMSRDDALEIRLLSDEYYSANIIVEGGSLFVEGVTITSYDFSTNRPDVNTSDGRSFIRVEAFVDQNGDVHHAHLEVESSRLIYLGYDSRNSITDLSQQEYAAYGVSLKVRSEQDLGSAFVTGGIRDSYLAYNYRGFYSYGALDYEFSQNVVFQNEDYGVDPHDDSVGFVAAHNLIIGNGGSGLALSRRCSNSFVYHNVIVRNGANGLIVHDLSNNVDIRSNIISGNYLDGIVVHDSNGVSLSDNVLDRNRNGIRLFAGATEAIIFNNLFLENRERQIFIHNGWLGQGDDLSDYSRFDRWNSMNISRHNDGRVRFVSIFQNIFAVNSLFVFRETEGVHLFGNTYTANAVFEAENSRYLSVDGVGANGGVSYSFRRSDNTPLNYYIDPPSIFSMSINSFDVVYTAGADLFIPSEGLPFISGFDEFGEPFLSAASRQEQNAVQSSTFFASDLDFVGAAVSIYNVQLSSEDMSLIQFDLSSNLNSRLFLTHPFGYCNLFRWSFYRLDNSGLRLHDHLESFYSISGERFSFGVEESDEIDRIRVRAACLDD